MSIIEIIKHPWPWYIAGPLIGLIVPLLLIIGNRSFGISSNLQHICAACIPAKIPFFNYDWKKEIWNLVFVLGIFIGGYLAMKFLNDNNPIVINANLAAELQKYGVTKVDGLLPNQLFSWTSLLTVRGFIMMVIGGFMIGFGTRYGNGCTSGHAILGISNLKWSSLVATCCFMIGGFIMANFILPYILSL